MVASSLVERRVRPVSLGAVWAYLWQPRNSASRVGPRAGVLAGLVLSGLCASSVTAALVLAPSVHPAVPPPEDCRGTRAVLRGTPAEWKLDCSGDCSGTDCKERPSSDGLGDFKHCGCSNDDTENCCNTILRSNGAEPEVFTPDKKGDCPPCPLNGVCVLQTITATEKQAGCFTQ